MMLTKWSPFSDLEPTMKQLFPKPWTFTPGWDDERVAEQTWNPAVNVYEGDKAWTVEAQLPGIDLKDVTVDVKEDVLTLKGTRSDKHGETKKDYSVREIRYGAFVRTFVLPKGIDSEAITAEYKDGMLTVTLPKGKDSQPRPIAIETA